MLILFSLKNYKSFRETAEISLLARKSDKTIRGAIISGEATGSFKEPLLASAAIYGANASGKTNFLLGLREMKLAVLKSQTSWKPNQPIPADPHISTPEDPVRFEVQIVAKGVRYRYGFESNKNSFIAEWLYSYPSSRERLLFSRTTTVVDSGFEINLKIGDYFSGPKRDHESTARRTRPNSLFLSAAAQDNQAECRNVYEWFSTGLLDNTKVDLSDIQVGLTSILAHDFDNFKKLLLPLMRTADGSISDIFVKRNGEEFDVNSESDEEIRNRIKKYSVDFQISDGENSYEINHDRESRGVKRLYALAAQLISALSFGKVIIVDELETSMHAHVASQLLALFQNKSSNPKGAQLIFATHETRLLNLQHLRRDQIWFCERSGLESSLYSLLEFSPRKDENFETGYLRGRYGAVPQTAIDPCWIEAINSWGVERGFDG
jgi:AAA15 family ATPase/GTPase